MIDVVNNWFKARKQKSIKPVALSGHIFSIVSITQGKEFKCEHDCFFGRNSLCGHWPYKIKNERFQATEVVLWDEVGYEYDRIEKYITKNKRHKNNFLLSQQLQALKLDKSKFHRYLNARFELAHIVNVYDGSCVLHYKSVIFREMF